jgi:hypothetical protein
MMEIISGVAAAIAIIIISRMLAKYFTPRLMAMTILVAIAFIYVGFSLKDNPVSLVILEVVVALILYFVAIIGYNGNSFLIAYGIIAHGVWDICHHHGSLIGTDVPVFWPSFCLVVDIIDGLYFLIIFRNQKKSAVLSRTVNQSRQ